ncbi:hypothetical protein B0H17DRAFT_1134319 [Mycena rosella]|uniref:Uncharacterized protein n=1 Tax=Mycena rosella TaxID=1033263 RepID=A0AAD7GJ76_MYCRO|nr:hypothetical protein B0H17DRAFT_1134319 [Mycena rosella]
MYSLDSTDDNWARVFASGSHPLPALIVITGNACTQANACTKSRSTRTTSRASRGTRSTSKSSRSPATVLCISIGLARQSTNPSTYLEAAPITELSVEDGRYEVTGQILSLVPFISHLVSDRITHASFEHYRKRAARSTTSANLTQATFEEILKVPSATGPGTPGDTTIWVFSNADLEKMCTKLSE